MSQNKKAIVFITGTLLSFGLLTGIGLLLWSQTPQKSTTESPSESYSLNDILSNPDRLVDGRLQYQIRCTKCHGNQGQGFSAPALNDSEWKYGDGSYESIIAAIQYGFPEKGMPGWDKKLLRRDIQKIAAYVTTLRKNIERTQN